MSVLSDCQIEQFHHDGFLLVEDVLDPEMDIQPVIDEYFELLDLLCNKWYAEGRIDSTYRELPFGDRLARVVTESDRAYHQYFDITLPQKDVGADTPMHLGKAVFDFLRNPRLLDVVEHFVGSEIYSNPVQHVRIKVPERLVPAEHRNGITAQTGWHQDQGVVLPEATILVWCRHGFLCSIPTRTTDAWRWFPRATLPAWLRIARIQSRSREIAFQTG